jgi:hypothetical protein
MRRSNQEDLRFIMRTSFLIRATFVSALGLSVLVGVASVAPVAQSRPKFYADDPIAREPDTQDASKVQEWDLGLIADLTLNVFGKPGDPARGVRAQNISTIDEVPDSSWFTNRIYAKPLSVDDLTRGPNTIAGPAAGKWTLIRAKTAGTAPGFTVRDEAGNVWFISMDSRGYPVAATAAIAVATRIFWALGYNEPESYLTTVRPENIVIGEQVTVPSHGRRRRFTQNDLDDVFKRSHRSADGSYRLMAQRALPGRVVGGFKYFGTRPDDPNDIVPHEHRRELRALQVFGAWANLVDMKANNTLDTVITENGRSYVRHYLQDVGSTFGTGSLHPREGDEGHEYVYEGGPTFKRLMTFGLYIRPWQTVDYEKNKEIGNFTADAFEPEEWKPRVPAAALLRARADDTLWGALRVMAFSDEHIRGVVKTGEYTDPAAEKLLGDVLIKRRDKIARVYLTKVNPLVKFALAGSGVLTFENPAVRANIADAPKGGYQVSWSRYDNGAGTSQPIGSPVNTREERLQAPSALPQGDGVYIKASISAVDAPHRSWATPVDVYFKRAAGGWQLVGVDRLPDPPVAQAVKK